MLKKRIVATVVVKNGIVVQSINFKNYLPVGKPHIAIEFLNKWGVDEIVLFDISASINKNEPDYEMIRKCSEKCFVPLTVGGGISSINHIDKLMNCGADKISLNFSAINSPELIRDAAKKYGSQCVVICIDGIKIEKSYKVYCYINKQTLDFSPNEFAKKVTEYGAGEIIINSVDRDGSYSGFDIDLINSLSDINIPIVCSGGAKDASDFSKVFEKTNVCGASAANFFHFIEHSVIITKQNIKKCFPIRIDTYADYSENNVNDFFRLNKKDDIVLTDLLNVRIKKQVI